MEQNETPGTTPLTERQLAALPYLVASPTLSEGTEMAHVGRTTLWRWMQDDDFRQELERLRKEAAELAHAELNGLMFKAAQVLGEAMEDPNAYVRLRAARTAISAGFKANESKEFQERLDRVEDELVLLDSRKPKW